MSEQGAASDSAEDRLIARYFRPLATHAGAFGLIDDAAAIAPPPGCDLVLKADAIVGGVHFFPDDDPGTVARKALRVNLSDLAAKGAAPIGFLLSLALPRDIEDRWLAAFAAGLGEDARSYNCPLFGGDTVRSPDAVMVSIAVFGAVPHGRMLMRGGAQAGDALVVTGTIGDAALGLALRGGAATQWRLDEAGRKYLVGRYLLPQPRNAAAAALRRHASGGMDVSDGLAGDLAKMCRAAGVSADVDVAHVPLSAPARAVLAAEPGLVETVLTGGDDFEVLASVPESELEALRVEASGAGVEVTPIGRFVAAGSDGPRALFLSGGRPLTFARPSYSHF